MPSDLMASSAPNVCFVCWNGRSSAMPLGETAVSARISATGSLPAVCSLTLGCSCAGATSRMASLPMTAAGRPAGFAFSRSW